jgi:excisionase family DNA binding protein
MSAAPKLLLDLQELADALGVHLATVYRMKDRGELPVPIVHVGRGPRVRTVDVEAWLERLAEDAETQSRQRTPALKLASQAGAASITASPGRRRSRGS